MADRLAALGGSLEVRTALGGGTTVDGRLPARVLAAPPQPAARESLAAVHAARSAAGPNSALGR